MHDQVFGGDRAAILHILRAPAIRRRAEPYVAVDSFDFAGLRKEQATMSGGESLLVDIAYELWHAEKTVGLWEVAQRLDPSSFRRVLEALALSRGSRLTDAAAA